MLKYLHMDKCKKLPTSCGGLFEKYVIATVVGMQDPWLNPLQ